MFGLLTAPHTQQAEMLLHNFNYLPKDLTRFRSFLL